MALKVDYTLANGIVTQYHKAALTVVDWHNKEAAITVYNYLTEKTREDGFEPVAKTEYTFSGEGFPFTDESGLREQAYNAIKQIPPYDEAKDA